MRKEPPPTSRLWRPLLRMPLPAHLVPRGSRLWYKDGSMGDAPEGAEDEQGETEDIPEQ